ncbi:DNA mismatch repair protein MSH6 isoform X1 [Zingiber officinale]|uniref:DNA mismatch repair protein MSH6 isoform X1 n=1 Tax=Zingiber officinale TaxID=94328 RepID=UPI001C4BD05C|nr:DNA mismatch repair protein MSH6 isoform X1 [Zingiber officinale]
MVPSRRLSGRSPLVRKQSQITTFFSPGHASKRSPNPSPSADPSPSQPKEKKPRLVISPSSSPGVNTPPSAAKSGFTEDVVGRRIKVFWPLDKVWYEGRVSSYDALQGKHLVLYDDGEDETLDLSREKFEWVEEEPPRRLRRLRRLSCTVEKDCNSGNVEDGVGEEDSSGDEEWRKVGGKDSEEDDSDEVELEDEDDVVVVNSSGRSRTSTGSKKRKKMDVESLDCTKKLNFGGNGGKIMNKSSPCAAEITSFCSPLTSDKRAQIQTAINNILTSEVAERFERREAEKFRFLRVGRMDAKRRRPGDENYDPKTLYLPPEFLKTLSGGQRQWWEFKSKHMDKVLFFKMGKFYELFEMDAHIGVRELDLQYMKGEQPHCGFPEKNYSSNLEKLARKGFRVLVVEQTETPEQLELRRKQMGSKDKVVKREICAVVSQGTLTEGESLMTNPDTSYILSVTENCKILDDAGKGGVILGLCFVDVSTSKFMIGQFEDDIERSWLRSMLSELRPVEVIKPSRTLSLETERVIRNNTRNPLVNDLKPSVEFLDAEKTVNEVRKYYSLSALSSSSKSIVTSNNGGDSTGELPDILIELVNSGNDGSCALSALGGCLFYLRQAFLDEKLLKCAKFERLPCLAFLNKLQKSYMMLDAAALENLEILENSNGGLRGTLFAQLDHCVTAFGKRLLKGWLARPLYSTKSIEERQDAIACFKGAGCASALDFRKELSRLPDMERLLSRLFSSCEAHGRNANRVILYEDASKKQLQEFIASLRGCETMIQACSSLYSILTMTESTLLHHLLTPGKGLPDMSPVIEYFKDAFDWSEANSSGRVIPHAGGDCEYDAACQRIKEIESNLAKYLKEQRKTLGNSEINYVTIGKDSYLLEVPESLGGAIPMEYEMQSSKKGYFRYWTPKIKKLLAELSQAEAEKESALKGILQRLIGQFSEHHTKWRQLVFVTAELDVLISVAIASNYYEGPTCRPIIREACLENEPYLSARGLGHPVLRSDVLGMGSFVPNDVRIGGIEPRFILLTGPNMGGKSTLLRQVCLAIVLAQLGADVPAESFQLSPVDRIFVRMGARDNIMAGQSTFLTELSETAGVLSYATQNSLVALDELGRGSSTSDGQAIAASVLEYLVNVVQCRGLFSTHYHRLTLEYQKTTKVSICHMACQVGMVEGVEEVTFLYRLTPGSCPKSYGVNVARLAGLPLSVLQKAAKKSNDFENDNQKGHTATERLISDEKTNAETTLIKELLSVVETWNLRRDSQAVNLSLLSNIQQRAKSLVPST